MILGNPLLGRADEAHPPCAQVVQTAEEVRDLQRFGMGIERVDGEIAPRGILAPVRGEGDGGAPPVGGDIAPQGGDLDGSILEDRGDGAVLDPRRHGADAGGAAAVDHLGGHQQRGAVDIMHLGPEQAVAHRPADPTDLVRPQRRRQRGEPCTARPFGLRQITQHP